MHMIWKLLVLVLFIWVIIGAWLFEPPMMGVEGPEVYRIFYFHVPVALVTFFAYGLAMYNGLMYLNNRRLEYDDRSALAAALGTIFCALATLSGSVFAKFAWRSFWNWDPRETSIVVLLLIYLAYFALRSAVADAERRAALSAVYSVLGFISAVFTIFIWPRLTPGLHPGAPGDSSGKFISMSTAAAIVFIPSLLAFTILFVWIYSLSVRISRLEQERAEKEI